MAHCSSLPKDYLNKLSAIVQTNVLNSILFPETHAIARTRAGTHASKFACVIYRTREIVVISRKEKFFIEGFSIEHN